MPTQGFSGLRLLALESRRASEVVKLIENAGGKATVVPAMREIPLESNHEAVAFAERLIGVGDEGGFDAVLFLTGSGARILFDAAQTRFSREDFIAALRRAQIIARGPKPVAVLREYGLNANVLAQEPSTWREILAAIESAFGEKQNGLRLAVQEYGAENSALIEGLEQRGVEVTRVPAYRWALPEDLTGLRSAVEGVAHGEFDVVLFLTGVQAAHFCEVARGMGKLETMLQGLRRAVVASIGPDTSEELQRQGIQPDFMPTHPRMGILVNEVSQVAAEILARKRS